MISVIVYLKYHRVCLNFVRLVELLSECMRTVGWRNLQSPVGLRAARAALWDKKTQLVRACLQRARQYFGYPGQDPNSPSQHIHIARSPWNFAMRCFLGLARCPCIAWNIKMHSFTKHLLWLTHAGVIPFVKTNDISRILLQKWYLKSFIGLHFCIQGHKPPLHVPRKKLMSSKSMLQATFFPCLLCKLMCILLFHAH